MPFVASEPLTQAAKLKKKRWAIAIPKYEYLGELGLIAIHLPLTPTIPVAALWMGYGFPTAAPCAR
jgi:hypothetical protein